MNTTLETSNNLKSNAFHSDREIANAITKESDSNRFVNRDPLSDAWRFGLDEHHWRHGITISLGNGLNVSKEQATRRLQYIALRLKRRLWGHRDEKQQQIDFIVFKHQLVNPHKKKDDLETGSRNWSDLEQKALVTKHYQDLKWGKSKKVSKGEHWHAVMAVNGSHGWSDEQIANAIKEIEKERTKENRWEKKARVDYDWRKKNHFHGYVGREVRFDADSYFTMRI